MPKMFIPITKVDAAKRLVYGVATAETEDRSGEICDYATSKPFYEKWSGDIAKSTGGKSLGNVRAMHGKIAAGKITAINFNDEAKQIEICAKVVDDVEWNKVEEGVYTGFSQGGSYVKRWKDENGLQRYTANPSEVSLVDLPCLPEATFEVIKADGAAEMRKFTAAAPVVSNDDVRALATKMAEEAGKPGRRNDYLVKARATLTAAAIDPRDPLESLDDATEDLDKAAGTAAEADPVVEAATGAENPVTALSAALEAARVAKGDVMVFADPLTKRLNITDAAAIKLSWSKFAFSKATFDDAAISEIEAKIDAAWKAKVSDTGPAAVDKALAGQFSNIPAMLTALVEKADGVYAKGLYTVANLCSVIDRLAEIQSSAKWESDVEGDNSSAPYHLADNVAAICATLLAMVSEEVSEILQAYADQGMDMDFDPAETEDSPVMAYAAEIAGLVKADEALMEKARRRHKMSDAKLIQDAHDDLVKLGAQCSQASAAQGDPGSAANQADVSSDAAKAVEVDTLAKAIAAAVPEIQGLAKTITDQQDEIVRLNKRIEEIAAMPLPPKTASSIHIVEKGVDSAGGTGQTESAAEMTMEKAQEYLDSLSADQRNLLITKAALARPMSYRP